MKAILLTLIVTGMLTGCASVSSHENADVQRYESGAVSFLANRDANGLFHGEVLGYWPSGQLAEQSYWNHGIPLNGKFYNEAGTLISQITEGTGWRQCPGHGEYYQDGQYIRGHH